MTRSMRSQSGMMMLECLIALAIFAIGVLGMVKMQALSSANSVNSEDRATAAMFANDAIAEMWTNGNASLPATDYSNWQTLVSNWGGTGTITVTGNVAQVQITWTAKGGDVAGTNYASSSTVNLATYMTQVTIQ